MLLRIAWLCHFTEPLLSELNCKICRNGGISLGDALGKPSGQPTSLVRASIPTIGKKHEPVVGFGAQNAADALGSMPQGVEGEKIGFADLVSFTHVLESGLFVDCVTTKRMIDRVMYLEDARFGVLIGHAKHDHCAAIVVVKVDALAHLSPCNRQEDGAAAQIACPTIGFKDTSRLLAIGCLDKKQLVGEDVGDDAHLVPHVDDVMHVQVGWEEGNQSVRRDLCHLNQEQSVVADNSRIVSDFEARTKGRLVGPARHNQRHDGGTEERVRKGDGKDRIKVEDLWIHCQRTQRSTGDDDALETGKHRPDGERCVETQQVQCRRVVGVVDGFEEDQKAVGVRRDNRCKVGDAVEGGKLPDICHL